MKVELKSVKVMESLSEETTCFSANIYIDGKKVGTAENRGQGGPTDYHINDPKVLAEFQAYGKSLPDKEVSIGGGQSFIMKMDAEAVIDELVHDYLVKKDEARIVKMAKKEKLKNTAVGFPITVQVKTPNGQFLWFGVRSQEEVTPRVMAAISKHKLENATHSVVE